MTRHIHSKSFRKVQPDEVNIEKFQKGSNKIDIRFNSILLKKKFKNLYKKIDHYTLGSLLATSKIVGMRAPGMFSRYISLKTSFNTKKTNFHILYNTMITDLIYYT